MTVLFNIIIPLLAAILGSVIGTISGICYNSLGEIKVECIDSDFGMNKLHDFEKNNGYKNYYLNYTLRVTNLKNRNIMLSDFKLTFYKQNKKILIAQGMEELIVERSLKNIYSEMSFYKAPAAVIPQREKEILQHQYYNGFYKEMNKLNHCTKIELAYKKHNKPDSLIIFEEKKS